MCGLTRRSRGGYCSFFCSAPTRSKSQSPPPRIECSSSGETGTCGIASEEYTGRRVQKASCGGVAACRCVSGGE